MTTKLENPLTPEAVRKRIEELRALYKLGMSLKAAGATAGLQPPLSEPKP